MIRRLVGCLVPLGLAEKGPEDTINTGGNESKWVLNVGAADLCSSTGV